MIGTYERLRVHVWATDLEVIRRLRLKIATKHRRGRASRGARHKIYRAILKEHHDARKLYSDIVNGNLGG